MREEWLEQIMPDGRKYYYNQSSGERTWNNPYYTDGFSNSGIGNSHSKYNNKEKGPYNYSSSTGSLSPTSSSTNLQAGTSSIMQSLSENARVFLQLLKDKSIPADLPWEKVMKEIMAFSEYRAVHTVQERKALWELYVGELKQKSSLQRQEVVREFKDRLFLQLDEFEGIDRLPLISLRDGIGALEEFEEIRMALTDKEMREVLEEYLKTFKDRQEQKYNEDRKNVKEYLKSKLRDLHILTTSKWFDYKDDLFYNDSTLNSALKQGLLSPKDVIYAFEDHLNEMSLNSAENKESLNPKSPSNTENCALEGLLEKCRKSLFSLVGLEKCWPFAWDSLLKSESALIDSILKNLSSPIPILEIYWQVLESNRRLYEREAPLINEVLRKRPFMQKRIEEFIEHIKRRREDVSTFSCREYFQKYFYEPSAVIVSKLNLSQMLKKLSHWLTKCLLITTEKFQRPQQMKRLQLLLMGRGSV
jgi:pre-mRNA-processing factor 40